MSLRIRFERIGRGRIGTALLTTVLLVGAVPHSAMGQTVPAAAQSLPLELTRYRVDIELTFGSDPMLSTAWQEDTIQQITAAVERSFGAMLDFRIINSHALRPVHGAGLERLQEADLLGTDTQRESYSYGPIERLDKRVFLTVARVGGRYRVAGREWDTRVRTLSRVKSAQSYQRRMVPERVVGVLLQLFRPLLAVDEARGDVIEMRVQAGEFPAPDQSAAQIRPGDIVFPVMRYRDKERVVQKVQFLPSTYVVVQQVERSRVTGVLVSGLRMTLSGRGRRRVDQMGLRRRPDFDHSDVDFVLRSNPRKQIVGNRVRVYGKTRANDKTDQEPLEFLTDRRGQIRLPQRDQFPMLWIYIHSGEVLLARVPYAVGFEPESTLQLLDDEIRLGVEGELNLIEGRLIDTIARRAVFMALALKQAEAGDKQGVTDNLERIQALPGLTLFQSRLNEIRVPALERARETKNRIAESRVDRLCDKLRDVIVKYMNNDQDKQFREKLSELLENAKADAK
jgi:hypothetical protein